jgi:hypothetical protein
MSSVALAAEPLTEQQMDTVTAGLANRGPFNLVQAGQKQHRFYLADVDRVHLLDIRPVTAGRARPEPRRQSPLRLEAGRPGLGDPRAIQSAIAIHKETG